MDAIHALHHRTSSPRLVEPAPQGDDLRKICQAALRAPDHGMLRPWRFLVVQGDAREKLGKLFVECREPADEAGVRKLLDAPMRAPMIIIAVASITENHKVPAIEQICSAAAAVSNMGLAAFALGYGAIWKTGGVTYDEKVKAALGIEAKDQIVAYLYLGTPTLKERPVPEIKLEDYFQDWA